MKVRAEMATVDMLTLVMGRSDGTLGLKVKNWSGTCPKVLRLVPGKGPFRLVVVESAQMPTAN